ncbi:MAG: isopenicillin N synthase family dioxygenase [Alphaproteobacteria bacterium]
MSHAIAVLQRHNDTEIPILDLAPYLASRRAALDRLAVELRYALERVGFYFIRGHGVPQSLCDDVFKQAERFHAQPLDWKMKLKRNRDNVGYLPMMRAAESEGKIRPNVNEAFFVKRDLSPDHPDVLARKRFRGANLWPQDLPGFRESVVAYCDALEALAKKLMPIYALALDLPADYFDKAFAEPQYTLRMSHYPFIEKLQPNEYGIAPHADTSFMTLLAQNKIPGLSLRTSEGRWIDAPALEGHFLVNGGDMLRRWTNDRFLATPHRAINRSGQERYAIPFFVDCNIDWPIECLPTCVSGERPAKYPRFTYAEYMASYQDMNLARDSADGVRIQAY